MKRNPIDQDEDKESEERIAALARELAEAINEGRAAGRTEARDYAIDLLKEEVETEVIATPEPRAGGASSGKLNPFGLGIPFIFVGILLLPLFSIVGVAISAIGALMCVVGLAMAVTGRFKAQRGQDG